jgi:hypothetical protein
MNQLGGCEDREGNQFFTSAMEKFAPHSAALPSDQSSNAADVTSARKRMGDSSRPLKSTKIALQSMTQSQPSEGGSGEQKLPPKPKTADRDIAELLDQFERLLDEARAQATQSTPAPSSSSLPPKIEKEAGTSPQSYHSRVFEARGIAPKLFEVDPEEGLAPGHHTSSSLSNYAERSEEIQHENISRSLRRPSDASGLLLVTQIICSSIRHLRCPQSKVISLMLLSRFGLLLSDNIILQRVVPFVMLCIEDPIAIVRATSIRCLRTLLSAVTEISQIDSNIFKDFLFPILNNVIARDTEAIVRVAFAESIGRFAETSMRFLDAARFNTQIKLNPSLAQAPSTPTDVDVTTGGQAPVPVFVEGSYDGQVSVLHDQVSKWIRDLVLDGNLSNNDRSDGRARSSLNSHSSIVKRAILEDIVRLCVFFGKQERIMDLFAQLLAYVNHTVCLLCPSLSALLCSQCMSLP